MVNTNHCRLLECRFIISLHTFAGLTETLAIAGSFVIYFMFVSENHIGINSTRKSILSVIVYFFCYSI